MDKYTARLDGPASVTKDTNIAEGVSYNALLRNIVECTLRAATARVADRATWEQEELRRNGLSAIHIFRNGRAVWTNPALFEKELGEAQREGIDAEFSKKNELDLEICGNLDRDLRAWWCRAGYESGSLERDMKRLFTELERDAGERAADAWECFIGEVLDGILVD
jgi:hypothetical protein